MNTIRCEQSDHPEKLHGVRHRDRGVETADGRVYGTCAYCEKEVVANIFTREPWKLSVYIIEEEPV